MLVLSLLALLQLSAQDPAPAPTAEETLALELVNRMRADPAAEAKVLLGERPREPFEGFDRDMFQREMEALEPQPPLVLHPRLIGAARNHTAYTAATREYGHKEVRGSELFTGEYSGERAAFAGYPDSHGRVLENAGSFIHGGVLGNHWGCAVDDGPGGSGGMQKNGGHRMAIMWPQAREFGAGFHWHRDKRCEGVMLFGQGEGHRLVGGIAYIDLDGDGFYDIGEGLGGVRISLGKAGETVTWSSGAYTLDPGGPAAEAGGKWVARLLDLTTEAEATGGTDNLKLDVDLAHEIGRRLTYLQFQMGRGREWVSRRARHDFNVWAREVPAAMKLTRRTDELRIACELWDELCSSIVEAIPTGVLPEAAGPDPKRRKTLAAEWMSQARTLAGIHAQCAEIEESRGAASTLRRKAKKVRGALDKAAVTIDMPTLLPVLERTRIRVAALPD